jgi:nickel/cobalt exporter
VDALFIQCLDRTQWRTNESFCSSASTVKTLPEKCFRGVKRAFNARAPPTWSGRSLFRFAHARAGGVRTLNMSLTVVVASGVGYGVLHGLAPDHCAALASLSLRGSTSARHATLVGFHFGLSHGAALGALVLLAVGLGVSIPPAFERAFEMVGGALLIVLGGAALCGQGVELWLHRHDASRLHAHVAAPSSARVGLVGSLFAASGARSLLLMVSPMLAASEGVLSGVAFVAAFALGVTLTMVLCGLTLGAVSALAPRLVRGESQLVLARAVGAFSLVLGVWWLVQSARSA